jgi:amino acid adenylation domain-containing protein
MNEDMTRGSALLDEYAQRFAGPVPALRLPLARPAGEISLGERDRVRAPVPDRVRDEADRICREHGCTPWELYVCAYLVCLARYGNESVILAVTDSAVNAVPILLGCDGDATLRGFLANVRAELGRLTRLGPASGREIAERVRPWHAGQVSALAQATAAHVNRPADRERCRGGLVHLAVEGDDPADLWLDFAAQALTRSAAERMASHLVHVLGTFQEEPDAEVDSVPLIGAEERRTLLAWSHPEPAFALTTPVHEQVRRTAAVTPSAPAVRWRDQCLSHGDLDRRTNRLAHHLRALGVVLEDRVGIYVEPGLERVIAPLAVLKAGGAYVPLDPRYPSKRVARVLADASARVLLTQVSLAGALPPMPGTTVVVLDGDEQPWAAHPPTCPDVPVSLENLAYVIYTSGSTGTPKGVMVEHRSLAHIVTWHNHTYAVDESDRGALVAGFSFDASVWELWPYLVAGASLTVAPEAVRHDPAALARWLQETAATTAFIPTPLVAPLIGLPEAARLPLRAMFTGGDRLTCHPRADLPFGLYNVYGPTECTVLATCGRVPSEPAATMPSVGRPIPGAIVRVLDGRRNPVPIGVPGEVYIGGTGVARGYLGNPPLNAERFLVDPDSAGTLYRTGDWARWTESGELDFVGRMDGQVKIRGYRIECGEIESVLRTHPAVDEAVVVVPPSESGEKRLAAYVLSVRGADVSPAGLRAHLRSSVPDWMLPSTVTIVGELPLTTNGKIDRRRLPAPVESEGLSGGSDPRYAAPRTVTEQAIAGIWADLLCLERVCVSDNFFDSGGDSMLAMELVARGRAQGIHIGLETVFRTKDLAELAAAVSGDHRGADELALS